VWYVGRLALDSLGFITEVYYASEVDVSAVMVTEYQHGDRVQHVGDVCQMTVDQVYKHYIDSEQ